MPMVALSTFVIIAHRTTILPAIEERIFQIMYRRWNGSGNAPENHLNDCAIIVINALMEKKISLHQLYSYMV